MAALENGDLGEKVSQIQVLTELFKHSQEPFTNILHAVCLV